VLGSGERRGVHVVRWPLAAYRCDRVLLKHLRGFDDGGVAPLRAIKRPRDDEKKEERTDE
jgi:hypothetical protein